MLRAADVTFGYVRGGFAVHDVSLEIADGAIVGVIGPNGSGKTTLLRLLAGLLAPQFGQVTLDGSPLASIGRRALARRLAVVPQETQAGFDYSVLEMVLMGRSPHLGAFQIEGPADIAAARDALTATDALRFQDRPFSTLSGGEKQRVVIAAALAQIASPRQERPPVLLLDEPTTALDLGSQLDLAVLLKDLHGRLGLSIVLSTHDLNFAAGLCGSLVMMRDGGMLAAGPTDETLTPPIIRALYGVDADVHAHGASGHLVVIPVGRVALDDPS